MRNNQTEIRMSRLKIEAGFPVWVISGVYTGLHPSLLFSGTMSDRLDEYSLIFAIHCYSFLIYLTNSFPVSTIHLTHQQDNGQIHDKRGKAMLPSQGTILNVENHQIYHALDRSNTTITRQFIPSYMEKNQAISDQRRTNTVPDSTQPIHKQDRTINHFSSRK